MRSHENNTDRLSGAVYRMACAAIIVFLFFLVCNMIACQSAPPPPPPPPPPSEPEPMACFDDGYCDYCWDTSEVQCPAEWFGSGDGCDCNCRGVNDPDCDPVASIWDAEPFLTCGPWVSWDPDRVEFLISLTLGDWSNGWAYADEVQEVMLGCEGFDLECNLCGVAVVDYVYFGL